MKKALVVGISATVLIVVAATCVLTGCANVGYYWQQTNGHFSMLAAAGRGGAVIQVQHSSDLGISDLWTSVVVPEVNGGPTSGVTFVVTPGSPLNVVEATISSSEAAAGKLFGRTKGIK